MGAEAGRVGCPRCGGAMFADEWGERYCLNCGGRPVVVPADIVRAVALRAEGGSRGYHRHRGPSRRGRPL